MFKQCALSFYDNGNFTYASSIAFYFLLSIIPFLSLAILIVNSLQSYFQVDYIELITPHLQNIFPFVPENRLASLIDLKSVNSVNIIAIVIFPIVSGFIFSVMDNAYRKIFALKPRHLIFSQMIYPTISISVILLLFIANIFLSMFSTYTHMIVERFPKFAFLVSYIPSMNSFVISTIVFLLFYILFINLFVGWSFKIKLKYKLVAAVLFYSMWIAAKTGFTYYLKVNTNISLVYGPLTSVVVIMLWTYYSSLVLLFTLEVLHYLHHNGLRKLVKSV